jgi:transcriptional regulator with XRE-family HTH domain
MMLTMEKLTKRELAGSIVRDEMARRGWSRENAAEQMHLSLATLHRVLIGADTVSDLTLRQVEGALDMPTRYLTYVVDGDTYRIQTMHGLREDLKHFTLEALESTRPYEGPERRTRQTG